jgi:pimeloyl-ACP methyl ester carboxylesterase
MSKLAAYLFNSGFNIYNVFLSQHYKVPAKKFWPKLRYRDGHPSVSKETILEAYKNPESDLFKQIFTEETAAPWEQNHNGWLHDAKRRLEELNELGGRVYVVGLSLGAEVALRLGAEDGGNRIQAVVAHGPYLQAKNPEKRDQIKLAGPFDNQTARINDLEFSVATVAAQHALGASLFLEKKS